MLETKQTSNSIQRTPFIVESNDASIIIRFRFIGVEVIVSEIKAAFPDGARQTEPIKFEDGFKFPSKPICWRSYYSSSSRSQISTLPDIFADDGLTLATLIDTPHSLEITIDTQDSTEREIFAQTVIKVLMNSDTLCTQSKQDLQDALKANDQTSKYCTKYSDAEAKSDIKSERKAELLTIVSQNTASPIIKNASNPIAGGVEEASTQQKTVSCCVML